MLTRIVLVAAMSVACAGPAAAQAGSDAGKFRYRPERVAVGNVYHYLKTNIDGTVPESVAIYVAAKDRIESFKYHPPHAGRAALVIAEMDWKNFSAKRLESWQVFSDDRKLFATLVYREPAGTVEVSIPSTGKPPETTAIKRLPFHVYNFDLASLSFAFPHLARPRGAFTVGIADPTFKENGPLFHYKGEAVVTYAGEELRNGVRCRKYRIDGAGLEKRGGLIWVNKLKGHVEDIEIALPDNPDWQSFKLRLTRVERMSRAQWEAFMKAQF